MKYSGVTTNLFSLLSKAIAMKLPSFEVLWTHALHTLRRFPMVLLSAAIGTGAALYMMEKDAWEKLPALQNVLPAAILGVSLFFVLTVLAEKRQWLQWVHALAQTLGGLALVFYYFSLPDDGFSQHEAHAMRFALFFLASHSLVAFAPYAGKGELNGFWQYNKTLLLRFLTAAFYSAALFIGLAVALLAVDQLFELNVKEERYGQLFFVIGGLFNTWFFLAGAPKDFAALERERDYPKGLKVFTQYVLLPLVVIYLTILYAYEAKIILEWDWPKGWVANLVLAFSVVGILALLLLHPVQQQSENKWVLRFGKWYYVALIPLVIMLLLAIQRRISDYGITESRYFVLAMGLALAVVVVYFIASRAKNIKIIPMLLCGLAFFSAFGPWGAFTVSRKSQTYRLERLLAKNNLLRDGFATKAVQAPPKEDVDQIYSILRYLNERHGKEALQPLFKENLETLLTPSDSTKIVARHNLPRLTLELLELQLGEQTGSGYWHLEAQQETLLPVAGFETLIHLRGLGKKDSTQSFTDETKRYTFSLDKDRRSLHLIVQDTHSDTLRFELAPWISNHLHATSDAPRGRMQLPREKLALEQALSDLEAKIYFNRVNGSHENGVLKVNWLDAEVLLRRREQPQGR